jgi:RNA polymerase sigma-70 factor (ECF subfamily)
VTTGAVNRIRRIDVTPAQEMLPLVTTAHLASVLRVKVANQGAELLNDIVWETEQFRRHRPHLRAVAYRMLGSVSEAEDALQEAWLRLSRSQQDTIHSPRAWLTTIVGRVCVDMLRARQSRREDYVGAWVPEPIVEPDEQGDPEQQTLIAESVGLALLVVLETLTPNERVAYVLHDMFALPFAEIAEIIDSSPDAARQLASRARRRLRGAIPQPDADLTRQRGIVDAFLAAARGGDFDELVAILDPDVVFRSGGAREVEREIAGASDVARTWATFGPRFATICHPALVNGERGLVLEEHGASQGAIGFTISGGRIATIDLTINPGILDPAASDSTLLSLLRARQDSGADRIVSEATGWPGVSRTQGELGSIVLSVAERELGHLHGDAVADVPLVPELRDQLVADDAALTHRGRHDPDWVTVPLDSEDGIQQTLQLLRANYLRTTANRTVDS